MVRAMKAKQTCLRERRHHIIVFIYMKDHINNFEITEGIVIIKGDL